MFYSGTAMFVRTLTIVAGAVLALAWYPVSAAGKFRNQILYTDGRRRESFS